jgi:hypothetical protein
MRLRRISGSDSGAAARAGAAETLIESIDSTAGIQHFLFAGIERMALGANVYVNILSQRGAGHDHIAATAGSGNLGVGGMDIGFHKITLT